ncbi:hypothetical protein CR970_02580 [Candidatus Saccharibacteria bacterium]|nr:MAG: hypothetical protein CR970_02580 [Candidatus Saccharibacteria bacterium]
MKNSYTLVINPGSTSRKYAVYDGEECIARLHFEHQDGRVVCGRWHGDYHDKVDFDPEALRFATKLASEQLEELGVVGEGRRIAHVAMRVVAPSSEFLHHRKLTPSVVKLLESLKQRAPLHIAATLEELTYVRKHFPAADVYGISDSAFHITKPDYAWNYGLPIEDADKHDIKRFGYHGLSLASAVEALVAADKLAKRVVICHLGGGASVTAVHNGRSLDSTMGYSPLEGLIMATRSGSIDAAATRDLKRALGLQDAGMEEYLYKHSGLLGLSNLSDDIRDLLRAERDGHHLARLALRTYIHSVRKGIGQMAGAMGGVDVLVFTGTVGERSVVMRRRIADGLAYLDMTLDVDHNHACTKPEGVECISKLAASRPVYVVPVNEERQMALAVQSLLT